MMMMIKFCKDFSNDINMKCIEKIANRRQRKNKNRKQNKEKGAENPNEHILLMDRERTRKWHSTVSCYKGCLLLTALLMFNMSVILFIVFLISYGYGT